LSLSNVSKQHYYKHVGGTSEETFDNDRTSVLHGILDCRRSGDTKDTWGYCWQRVDDVKDVCLYAPCYCVLHTAVRVLSCQWNAKHV